MPGSTPDNPTLLKSTEVSCQHAKAIAADRWSEALVAEVLEVCPRGHACVMLQSKLLIMSNTGEVVRCEPNFVHLHHALPAKELFTSCEPAEWILLPIVVMELEHTVNWNRRSRPAKFH